MEKQQKSENAPTWEALRILRVRWKDGSFREILEDWRWIFGYSARYKKAIAFYVLLGIVSTSLGLVSTVAGKYMIDIITGFQFDRLPVLALVMVCSAVVSMTFTSLVSRITTRLSIFINQDIQADIFDRIMDADWLSLSRYSNGDVLNRFNGDVRVVSANAINWLPSIILAVYHFAATFGVIFYYDRMMALLVLASAPVLLAMSKIVVKKQRAYSREVREMSSRMMSFEVETFYNMDTIKSFGAVPQYSRKMRGWQEQFKDLSLRFNLFSIKTGLVMSVVRMIVEFATFGYCLYRLWTGSITYGTMTLFLQQRTKLADAFQDLAGILPGFLNSSVSAHRLRELVELPREVHLCDAAPDEEAAQGLEVRMEQVCFGYEENREVIRDSGFRAMPGEIVALIGPSGEGKTTMIRLILGLLRPEKGRVELISSKGRRIEMNAELRHLFSYVPQGNTILCGTIAENLRMVREDASEEELIEALKIACAWDFVEKLPQSLHTNLGERGRGLSEGQAQRIAIARAVLRDCPVLLLDEATSALDVSTERQVLRNLVQRRPNKTCIVTTHRPSVLNLCQRVYRVVDGTVTQLDAEASARMAMDF